MQDLSAITIVIDLPDGYTVGGALLADYGPFDEPTELLELVRASLGSRWRLATRHEVEEHYGARYALVSHELLGFGDQLTLF